MGTLARRLALVLLSSNTVFGAFDLATPLNQIPFIMTHDTAMGYLGEDHIYARPESADDRVIAWSKTQIGTVTEQLNCGARAFDMRPHVSATDGLVMHHGGVVVFHPFKDMMEEMAIWAADHPNDLVIAEVVHCGGDTDDLKAECDEQARQALIELDIPFIFKDFCPDALQGMTLGDAMEIGSLEGGGSVLAIWGQCWKSNYDSSRTCRGYEYETAGVSRKYSCWLNGTNPDYAVERIFEYLDATHADGPPDNGMLWQMQALWQISEATVSLGTTDFSSILTDHYYSRLNRFLFENLTIGRWGVQGVNGVNMFEVDNVCDQGSNILLALDPASNVNISDYPDDVVINFTSIHDGILANESILFPDVPADYPSRTFSDSAAIRRHHRNGRWGNTNDIIDLINSNDEGKEREYLMGIMGSFLLMLCIFIVWALALLYFKWSKKLDWLAGEIPDEPESPAAKKLDGDSVEQEDVQEEVAIENPESPTEKEIEQESVEVASSDHDESTEKDLQEGSADETAENPESPTTEQMEGVEGDPVDDGSSEDKAVDIELQTKRIQTRVKRIRITVLACGFLILIFSGLLIGIGFKGVDDALDSAETSLPELRGLIEVAQGAADDFLVQANQTREARIDFINVLVFNCNVTGEALSNVTGLNVTDPLKGNGTDDLILLNETLNNSTFLIDEVSNINKSLASLANDILTVEDTVDTLQTSVLFPMAVIFILVVDLMVIVFMYGVYLAWKKRMPRLFNDCNSRIAIPLFLLLLFTAYLVSALALVGATLAADFCIDTPDNQILRLIDASPPFDEFLAYYVKGCDPAIKPELLFDVFKVFEALIIRINDILIELSEIPPESLDCNNTDAVYDSLGVLQQEYNTYVDVLYELALEMNCANINPIYAGLAYQTGCVNGFDSLSEIFGFLLVIALCSMTIVTLRVAFYQKDETQDEPQQLKQDENEYRDEPQEKAKSFEGDPVEQAASKKDDEADLSPNGAEAETENLVTGINADE